MTHEHRAQSDEGALNVTGKITTRTWTPETLRSRIKAWPLLESDAERLARIRDLDDSWAETTAETSNIVVDGLLSYIAEGLDPSGPAIPGATHLALGTDNTAPTGSNTSLGNEVYRTTVGDASVDGADLITSTFISQMEANGEVIREIGLAGGTESSSRPLLTHAVFDSTNEIEKNSSMVATIDYVLELRRGGT